MTFSVAVICVSLIVVTLIAALIATKRPKNYPPGPVLLPVLGSIYAVPGQGAHFKIEKWRQKYGNIIGHRYGSSYEVYITGVEESLAAMKHPNFQGRKIFNHRNDGQRRGLFFNDGANWAVLKRFTLNYFSEYQKSKIQDLVRDEMTEVLSHNLTDTIAQMDYRFFPIVINILMRIIFGVTKEARNGSFDKIFTYLYKSLHETRPTGIENYLPLIRKIFFKKDTDIYMVKNVLKKYIDEHKSTLILDQPRDYVDAFLIEQKIRENGVDENNIFTDEELLSDCLDLVRAGSISTSDTIALVMLYLVLYPEVQRKMIKEIDTNVGCDKMPSLDDRKKLPYCEAVIAECWRINPVVPFTAPHRATEDTEFYGFVIPRDTVVKVSLWTLFRDPKLWNDPDTFEPERFIINGEFVKYPFHLPFGLGKRSCLMEVMARNIIFLYLTSFFQKFSIHQPPNEPPPSTEAVQGSVTGPKPFKVLIKRRNS